jgi:uncharacterized protein (TIGR03435 family)
MRWICVSLLLAALGLAQQFEVVSVKPNASGSGDSQTHRNNGGLTMTNVSLKSLIMMAYGVREYQVEGPVWLSSECFDVAAKFPEAVRDNPDGYSTALHAMMQKMLAERFKLTVHREQKTFSVYGLVVGNGGIKFKEVPKGSSNSNSENNHYTGTGVSITRFADFLSFRMDLPVLDMTGLTGAYDLKLDWVPEPPNGDAASSGPVLTDAIQDQLGLKLERRQAPMEIVVVDHAERVPTEN